MARLHGSIEEKYEILERLRQGGMGAVYKVRHRLLDEVRVVKVLRSYALGGDEAQIRFLQEARVASRLRHPNLAVLHDFAVDEEGDAYLVSEFIDGWTLRDLLRRLGPPPLSLGLEIGRQALKALGYLHRQRIVHRDISPDNLMLTRDADGLPLVELIDLGIAKALEDGAAATASGIFLGKPRYASPEHFGAAPVDERSDLYSLGVVLYELLTGRCPIAGHDPLSLMAGHLNQPPLDFADSDPEGRIPSDLREILLATLEKRPEDRVPDAEELSRALAEVQARYPVSAEDLEPLFALPLPAPAERVAERATEPSDALYLRSPEPETTYSGSLPLAVAPMAGPLPARPSAVDEVTWGSAGRRSPAPGSAGSAMSSSLLFRLAVSTAALLVLFLFARGFWWPGPGPEPEQSSAPEWAAGPRQPAAQVPPAAAEPDSTAALPMEKQMEEPAAEPTLVDELSDDPPEPVVPPPSEPEPQVFAEAPPRPERPRPAVAMEPAPVPQLASLPVPSRRISQPWEDGPQPPDLLKPGPGVEEPVPLDFPRYGYPSAARGTGLRADVRLALLVDERGQVIEARIREGAPPDLGFAETALAAGRRIPFQPATRHDVPGKMWTEVILEFIE